VKNPLTQHAALRPAYIPARSISHSLWQLLPTTFEWIRVENYATTPKRREQRQLSESDSLVSSSLLFAVSTEIEHMQEHPAKVAAANCLSHWQVSWRVASFCVHFALPTRSLIAGSCIQLFIWRSWAFNRRTLFSFVLRLEFRPVIIARFSNNGRTNVYPSFHLLVAQA